MKKIMLRSLAVLMIIGAFTAISFAQSNNKLIKFTKDKNSVVEKFTIPANDGITYVFSVKQWNLIKFTVAGMYSDGTDAQGLTIKLTKMGEDDDVLDEASPGEEKEYQFVNSGGDYIITVMNPGRKKANITLNLALNPESSKDSDVCDGCDYPGSTKIERIQLAKGQSDVDLDIQIEGKETKSFVAYVLKGYMTCIVPDASLGSSVTIRVNGKVLNPDNSPCTERSTKAEDQVIEFINNGNKEKNFSVSVGFHQKN